MSLMNLFQNFANGPACRHGDGNAGNDDADAESKQEGPDVILQFPEIQPDIRALVENLGDVVTNAPYRTQGNAEARCDQYGVFCQKAEV